MRVVAVIGNPRRGGRTSIVAERVAARVAAVQDGNIEMLELSDIASELFSPSPVVGAWTARVRSADAAIFASPTYKAGLTGLLKAFLDQYDTNGLAGLLAVPVMLGGSPHHALAVEMSLRPVLVELAAVVPTKGLYVVDSALADLEQELDSWWSLAGPALRPWLSGSPIA